MAGDTVYTYSQFVIKVNTTRLQVFKSDSLVYSETVDTATAKCTGFIVPGKQPASQCFIISKRQRKNGKLVLLYADGQMQVIPGGSFWYAPKHQLLFILAERDLTNLLVFSLKQRKTLLEKFNCDEYADWYLYKGNYYGLVEMECSEEPRMEKEISEWLHPHITEKFDLKDASLNETFLNERDIEKATLLQSFCNCSSLP